MKALTKHLSLFLILLVLVACQDEMPVANHITLHFHNTFNNTTIVLGNAASGTKNTSAEGQSHSFSELKYVISNIRLIKADGSEFPYHINDLDKGAAVVNHSKAQTLDYVLSDIPVGEYRQIRFGLGVKKELNTLDQVKFPKFYAEAGANDTEMMWEWGAGYRFTKLEGFYGEDNKEMSIHTGSTVEGAEGAYTQGVDAYRDITLELGTPAVVGQKAPGITIKADFDKLLSGKTHTIKLTSGTGMGDNATPNIHTAVQH
ncbi:MAG: hypothetical protein LRY55_01470, partial [Leadbetterella sp.]|nr:hypothetical protein [Leadbetterella sp.]